MKTLLVILSLLLSDQSCWCQDATDIQFLKGIYSLSEEYSVWDDTIYSFRNTNIPSDSVGEYFFFSSVDIIRRGDTVKLSANIGSIFKVANPTSEREELMFNGCKPYIELAKIDRDSCWRGSYTSESTGLCNAIMTVKNGNVRIAGIGMAEPFVFFTRYRTTRPNNEIAMKIRKYIGE